MSGGEFFLIFWYVKSDVEETISFMQPLISDFTSLAMPIENSFKYSATSDTETESRFNSSALQGQMEH